MNSRLRGTIQAPPSPHAFIFIIFRGGGLERNSCRKCCPLRRPRRLRGRVGLGLGLVWVFVSDIDSDEHGSPDPTQLTSPRNPRPPTLQEHLLCIDVTHVLQGREGKARQGEGEGGMGREWRRDVVSCGAIAKLGEVVADSWRCPRRA